MIEITVKVKSIDLTAFLTRELSLNYGTVQKLYRKRDIKVNGTRVGESVTVIEGALISVYLPVRNLLDGRILFEDAQVIVLNKPSRMETCEAEAELSKIYGAIYSVHRLDRNTAGVIIFARTEEAKEELDACFKDGRTHKIYHAEVVGCPCPESGTLTAYLYKDAESACVKIVDSPKSGYVKIMTGYKVLENKGETSILEVYLYTGKTHQIRAHLAHIGCPILGDEKYGDTETNRRYHKRFQCLECVSLALETQGILKYLSGRKFTSK